MTKYPCNQVVYLTEDKMASCYCYLPKGHTGNCLPHPLIKAMYESKPVYKVNNEWRGGLSK